MPHEPLEQLRPIAKPRMMDLVEQAGLDVTSWAYKAGGAPVAVPAANPAHCYEWCYCDDEHIVINLWFDTICLEGNLVVERVNMRKFRRRIERAKHLEPGTRAANVRRAMAVDSAVLRAFRDKFPVRVIVCDGERRDPDDVANRDSSKVQRRLLDPSPWRVTAYDYSGGDAVIERELPLETRELP